jgi:hypothetical protein
MVELGMYENQPSSNPLHTTCKQKSFDKHFVNCRLLEDGQKLEKLLLHKLCLSLAKIPGNLKELDANLWLIFFFGFSP